MSKDNSQQIQHIKDVSDFPSLDFALNLTKERIADQLESVDGLDTKANFVLGSATAFVSAALVLQAVLLPSHCKILTNKFAQTLPLLLLLMAYLVAMLTAFLAYRIRDYEQVPNPSELYKHYLRKPEHRTKAAVFRAMVEAFKQNEEILRKKASWINRAFVALGCEALILVSFLLFQTTC